LKTHYAFPKNDKNDKDVENVWKSAVPKKMRLNTPWAENTWHDWVVY